MQVLNLIDYFRTLATTHTDIESFGTGDLFEVAIAGEDLYVQLWLEQIFQNITTNGRSSWSVNFIIHAIQKHDESDENALLDSTFLIGQQVIQKIRNDGIYVVGDSINTVSFTERFEDFTCGWRFEITLTEALGVNRCDIGFVFDMRCNYAGSISGVTNPFLNNVVTDQGNLFLPSLPVSLFYAFPTVPPAIGAALSAELSGLGYSNTVLQNNIPRQGPGGRDTAVELIINISGSLNTFLCLVGSANNTSFTATCDCFYSNSFNEATVGGTLNAIIVNDSPLVLASLPFDFSFSAPNFEADRVALENELISLGYEATVTDVTPPFALSRTVNITILNPFTGDEWNRIEANVANSSFLHVCS